MSWMSLNLNRKSPWKYIKLAEPSLVLYFCNQYVKFSAFSRSTPSSLLLIQVHSLLKFKGFKYLYFRLWCSQVLWFGFNFFQFPQSQPFWFQPKSFLFSLWYHLLGLLSSFNAMSLYFLFQFVVFTTNPAVGDKTCFQHLALGKNYRIFYKIEKTC